MPYYCLTSCKKLKNSGSQFGRSRPQGVKRFFRKSENVTFLQLCCSNFVQNIKNFWYVDPEISALRRNGQTDGRTDKAEFIGPFRLKPWVQKMFKQKDSNWIHLSHHALQRKILRCLLT